MFGWQWFLLGYVLGWLTLNIILVVVLAIDQFTANNCALLGG